MPEDAKVSDGRIAAAFILTKITRLKVGAQHSAGRPTRLAKLSAGLAILRTPINTQAIGYDGTKDAVIADS